MKNEVQFTSGQFAKLHHINKRTLHYYDSYSVSVTYVYWINSDIFMKTFSRDI
ncbi:MAG: hypothetical protein RR986_07455 [Longicatena sp.]